MEWKEKPSRQREQSVQARVTTLAEANVTAMYPPRIWGTTFTEVSRPRSQLLGP